MAKAPQQNTENLIVIDACLIDGEHVEVDTVLRDVPVNDARDLRSSGRVRLAVDEADMAAAEKRAADRAQASAAPVSAPRARERA